MKVERKVVGSSLAADEDFSVHFSLRNLATMMIFVCLIGLGCWIYQFIMW